MANKHTEELIKELSDTQIEALAQLQQGLPEGVINAQTIQSLDERDLINRIQYTSSRSTLAIAGWALSEEGNKIVEELKRRYREEQRAKAGVPEATAKEPAPKKVEKAAKKESKKDSDKGN